MKHVKRNLTNDESYHDGLLITLLKSSSLSDVGLFAKKSQISLLGTIPVLYQYIDLGENCDLMVHVVGSPITVILISINHYGSVAVIKHLPVVRYPSISINIYFVNIAASVFVRIRCAEHATVCCVSSWRAAPRAAR